jgi:hypothetical protein
VPNGQQSPEQGRLTPLVWNSAGPFRWSIGSERPCELTQSLLVPLVRDLGEVTGELEAHPLARADPTLASVFEPVEKIADRNAKHLGYLKQATCGDAVDTALVFVCLLIGDPYQIGKLLLCQPQHNPTLANTCTDMAIDVLGSARGSTRRYKGRRRRIGLRAAA